MWKTEDGRSYLDCHIGGMCYIRCLIWEGARGGFYTQAVVYYENAIIDCLGKPIYRDTEQKARDTICTQVAEIVRKGLTPVNSHIKKYCRQAPRKRGKTNA